MKYFIVVLLIPLSAHVARGKPSWKNMVKTCPDIDETHEMYKKLPQPSCIYYCGQKGESGPYKYGHVKDNSTCMLSSDLKAYCYKGLCYRYPGGEHYTTTTEASVTKQPKRRPSTTKKTKSTKKPNDKKATKKPADKNKKPKKPKN